MTAVGTVKPKGSSRARNTRSGESDNLTTRCSAPVGSTSSRRAAAVGALPSEDQSRSTKGRRAARGGRLKVAAATGSVMVCSIEDPGRPWGAPLADRSLTRGSAAGEADHVAAGHAVGDRTRAVEGKRGSVRVEL